MTRQHSESSDPTGIAEGFTAAEHYQPSKQDLEMLGRLREMFGIAHRWRAPYEREWEVNRNFFKGQQPYYRDRSSGEILRGDARQGEDKG